MLSARTSRRSLHKPLPLKIIKDVSRSLSNSFSISHDDDTNNNANQSDKSLRKNTLPVDHLEPSESINDYTIEDESDDDSVFLNNSQEEQRRKSLTTKRQSRSNATPTTSLTNLVRPTPLTCIKKRKRRPPATPSTPLNPLSQSSLNFDGIDESSPVKKVKGTQYADQSNIFISRSKKHEKKSPHQKNRDTNDLTNQSLVDQLKSLIEKERSTRTVWRHSVTSQLKNKFKEVIKGKDTLTMKLSNLIAKTHYGLADGEIIETTIQLNYKAGDIVSLIFPTSLCENMGFSNGTVIQFVSPWNVINIRNQRFIINPFWISVVKRSIVKDDRARPSERERTLVEWTCPCQESFGRIDPLDCNLEYSQNSSQT